MQRGGGVGRREVLRALAGLTLAPLALAGCRPLPTLTVGIHPWPGYEPLYLAEHFGWLPERITLHGSVNAGASLAALEAGDLAAAALTLDEVLKARVAGVALSVVAVLNDSVGADMVVSREPLPSLAALAGARLAVERSALGELVLSQVLAAAGLGREQLTLVDLAPDQQLSAWQAGRLDAAITYEPFASQLLRAGAIRLFDSSQFPDLVLDVLAVRTDILRWERHAMADLVAAHFRGLGHLKSNPGDALRRIGAWRGLTLAEVRRTYAGLELPGLAANHAYLADDGVVMRAASRINSLLVERGLMTRRADLTGLVSPHYLPEGAWQ